MNDRKQRILQGVLLLIGILLMLAPYYRILPANISYFLGCGCFAAIYVIEYYGD